MQQDNSIYKSRLIFKFSTGALFLVVALVLSLGFKANEKIKADYSSAVCPTGDVVISTDTTWDDTAYMLNGSSFEIHCKSITINAGKTLTIPPKTTATKASLSGRKLTLDNDLVVNGTLLLDSGGKSPVVSTDNTGFGMELYIAGNVTLSSFGTISADGLGYDSGKGPGEQPYFAAYGGEGSSQNAHSTAIYGSTFDPIDIGSGGVPSNSGGGIIKITVGGTITNDGSIEANGIAYGSGGAVNLSANIITGSASAVISARGDIGGGGGRIAIKYTASNTFAGTASAAGGSGGGGAGTIFYSKNDGTNKELVIAGNNDFLGFGPNFDNYDNIVGKTKIESNTYKNITVEKRANAYVDPVSVVTISGGTFEINNSKFENKNQINSGNPSGDLLVKNTARFFSTGAGVINLPNSNVTFDETNTYFESQSNKTQYLGNLSVTNGAVLSHALNDATGITDCLRTNIIDNPGPPALCVNQDWGDGNGIHFNQKYTLRLNVDNLFIDSQSSIDVSEKGFDSVATNVGHGPGGSTFSYNGRQGGSYGGQGGNLGLSLSADAYGDQADPNDLGSSGYAGFDGGGLVRIKASGDIINDGSILANSHLIGNGYAGGSGGGIKLDANRILGAGQISANGQPDGGAGGGGGGGRIAIIYKASKDFYGPITAYSPNNATYPGGPGTIFFAKNNSGTLVDKELVISNSSITNDSVAATKIKGDTYKNITIKNTSASPANKTTVAIDSGETVSLQDSGVIEINKSNITNNGAISLQAGTSTMAVKNGSNFYNVGPLASAGINANNNSKVIFDGANTYFENQNNLIQNLGNLYIQNGALFSHKANSDVSCFRTPPTSGSSPACILTSDPLPDLGTHYDQNYTLRINANNVYIDSSSGIDVSQKGYGQGMGPGASLNGEPGNLSGATYGGKGVDGSGTAAAYYGSAADPDDLGSGAYSNNDPAIFGGGLVRITSVNDFVNYGSIKADATLTQLYSGHSGGGIKIQANNILGDGTFSAKGGTSTHPSYLTNGGGGRIALIYTKKNYTGSISVGSGGTGAEDGTVYDNNAGGAPVTLGPSSSPLNYSTLPSNNTSYIRADNISNDSTIDEGQPFGAYATDSFTKLLLHMDGADQGTDFPDASGTSKIVASASTVTSTATQEFGTASGAFDGVGSLLSTPDSDDFFFNSGDFTIDSWINLNQVPSSGNSYTILSQWEAGGNDGWHFALANNDAGFYGLYLTEKHSGSTVIGNCSQASTDMIFWASQVGKWTHVAVVRSGNNFIFYANGEELYLCSNANPIYNMNASAMIGGNTVDNRYFKGNIDELRVSKGIARWTSPSFTLQTQSMGTDLSLKAVKAIPTAAPDPGMKLLLHMDGDNNGTSFLDSSNSSQNVVSNGAVTKTGAGEFQLGNASAFFSGSSNNLTVAPSGDFTLGTNDWTIDFWLKVNGYGFQNYSTIISDNINYIGAMAPSFPHIFYTNFAGQEILVTYDASTHKHFFDCSNLGNGSFHHVGVERSGNDIRVFCDGIESGTSWDLTADVPPNPSLGSTNGLLIGDGIESGNHYSTNGYIDELRIVNGVAEYNSSFAPPLSPYVGTDYLDSSFNGTADIYLTDNLAGQYVFSGCSGASCQTFSDHVTATFTNGKADVNLRVKDVRTGQIKHHNYSSFRFVTTAAGYLNDSRTAATTELQDKNPERPISPANITAGPAFSGGVGFNITMNDIGAAQYQQDLGGYMVVRGPLGGAFSFTPDRKVMYKVGDVPLAGYIVVCVGLANYSDTKNCVDNNGIVPPGDYTYGFYTFDKTYDFYTQNEVSNYSLVALPMPISIPAGVIEPDNVTNFAVTPNNGKLTVSWTNPINNIGQTKTLVVRRENVVTDTTGPLFVPADGTDYNNRSNTGHANENIVYDSTNVGASSASISFDDPGIVYGANYCYDIYTQFVGLNYPPAGLPDSVCAVPTPSTNPVSSLTASVNGMRASLFWGSPNPFASVAKYIVIREAGSVPDFVPVNGTDYITPTSTPYKTDLGNGNTLVYDGPSNSFDDNYVDNTQYYYKVFVQYDFGSGPVYSSGVASDALTPVAGDVANFSVSPTPTGPPYDVLITSLNPPNPSYNLSKYIIVREINNGCSISFAPVNNTDYSVGPSGVTDENIIYADANPPTLPYTDSVGVSTGQEVCYKTFVQYSGETGGSPDPHLIYSPGTAAQVTPPNHPPQIQIINIAQTSGSENVAVQYQVLDQDSDNVNVAFTLNSPCGPTVIGNSGTIAATPSWSATKIFNWNSAGTICPNVETNSANISAQVTDTPAGDFNIDNKSFLLDTKAPVLPVTPSNFNLVLVSKTNNSITLQLGANSPTDSNPNGSDYVYKMYYATGPTVSDMTGTLISIPPDTPFNNYSTAQSKTFTVSGLTSGQQYTFNIWMYDNYGHKTSAPLALQETTKGLPPNNFQANSQGMRVHLSWSDPATPPSEYLIIRKKGGVASTWTPTDGVHYNVNDIISVDEKVVFSGAGNTANDDLVDDVAYTYTTFSNYTTDQYSSGVSATANPNPPDISSLTPSYVPDGSNYDIELTWTAPNPSYSLQKYVVVAEVGDSCSIDWAPTKNVDVTSTGAIPGYPNEYWAYVNGSNDFIDPVDVASGTKVCYKLFVQYQGEDISNIVYSPGIPLTLVPPNVPPVINTNVSASQAYGGDDVTINYEVKDPDSTQLDITFSIINPNNPSCNLNLSDHLTGINGTFSPHSIVWTAASGNGTTGDCPGFELNDAVIQVTASDSLNSVSQNSSGFKLDTRAPQLPTPSSDFNLTNFSTSGSSISFNLGAQSATDVNPKPGANSVYKIYYSEGPSTDETSGALLGGDGFNNYDTQMTYTANGLNPGSQYTFNIWMYDAFGHKTNAGAVEYTPGVEPASSFTAISAGMRIILNWNPPVSSTPDEYIILRRSGSAPTTNSLPDGSDSYNLNDLVNGDLVVYNGDGVGGNAPPINDDNVDNTTYYYKIFAYYSGSGKYSSPLSANATAVAEDVTGYNATSDNTKVTLFSSPPNDTTNLQEYLTWKIANSDCSGTWTPTNGVAYTENQSIGSGDIIRLQNTPPNNYDDMPTSPSTQYCYKTFVEYSGESSDIIYSSGNQLTVTPTNNPPQVQITSVVQTPGSEDAMITYEVKDLDSDPVNVTFQMNGPCSGTTIDTVYSIPTTGSWSSDQTYDWIGAGSICSGQESDIATIKASVTDTYNTTSATSPNFIFDTKSPTTLPTLPMSDFNLGYVSKDSSSITLQLSSNNFFSNPNALDSHPKGSNETYKIYYKLGNTVDDTNGTLLAQFDNYQLAQQYTAIGLLSNQSYAFNIWVYDAYGHKSSAPNSLIANTGTGNMPPNIYFVDQPTQQSGTDLVDFGFEFQDPDSDNLTITPSLVNAPGGCSISNANISGYPVPVASSPSLTDIDAVWSAAIDCDGQELALPDNLQIELSADDGNGHIVNTTSNAFILDTRAPSQAPGNLSVSADAASGANVNSITTLATSGTDANPSTWRIYRVAGSTFPADPSVLTPLQSYGSYPGVITISDTGLSPNSPYTYNICLYDFYAHFTCASPQTITTQNPSLTFTIAGVASGQPVGPETTTVDTTTLPINFGDTAIGATQVAGLTLQGGSNLTNGYTINVQQNNGLTFGANTIPSFTGTNVSPLAWPGSPNTSLFGYTSDSIARFSNAAKWSGFSTSPDPVVTRNAGGNFNDDFLIKLFVGNDLVSGNYANTITFSMLANP